MTALTTFFTNATATTISTACTQITASGGSGGTSKTTKIGSATNWIEIFSKGTTTAQTGTGSQGSPTGNGWLWDVTTLEGNTLSAASGGSPWTFTFNIACSAISSITADIVVRFYEYNGGTYTLIDSVTKSAQSIGLSAAAFSASDTTASSHSFTTGSKLYVDLPTRCATRLLHR